MNAFRTFAEVCNNEIRVVLPVDFNFKKVEIIIFADEIAPETDVIEPIYLHSEEGVTDLLLVEESRLSMVAHLKGSIPDVPYSKYDFYEQ